MGEMTDGPRNTWMEFYDVDKMVRLFEPARVERAFEYEWHKKDFNWFDFKVLQESEMLE